jgi:hypothetical protein
VPLAKTGGQSPCRFGDNLERTGYGVKMQVRLLELIERQSIREALRGKDVIADIH